jgi:hypothetical protein
MKLPIFNNTNGRDIIGYASGLRSATVAIRRLITVPNGSTLYVWRRPIYMQDLLELPGGFCYSICHRY